MKNIHHESKKLYIQLKGDLSIPSIMNFLESKGYNVVFFNTEDGDDLLRRYNIDRKNVPSFIYTGITKVVFVDDLLHAEDKLYCLLHECGHLIMNHIKENEIHTMSKLSTECEADAFAYSVMKYSPLKTLRNILLALLAAALIIFGTVSCTRAQPQKNGTSVSSNVSGAITTPRITSENSVSETVYVTPSGTKYHRANCRYVKNKDASALSRTKAEKTHDPCSVCNP